MFDVQRAIEQATPAQLAAMLDIGKEETMERTDHPLAGKTVRIRLADSGKITEGVLENWWTNIAGKSWHCDGNPACLIYAARSARVLPIDDEVVYVKIGCLGNLIHTSELEGDHG